MAATQPRYQWGGNERILPGFEYDDLFPPQEEPCPACGAPYPLVGLTGRDESGMCAGCAALLMECGDGSLVEIPVAQMTPHERLYQQALRGETCPYLAFEAILGRPMDHPEACPYCREEAHDA